MLNLLFIEFKTRYIIIFFAILSYGNFFVFSQEMVFETDYTFNNNFGFQNQSLIIKNEDNGEFMLILFQKKLVDAILFDKNFKEKQRFKINSFPPKYKTYVGHQIKNNIYHIFFSNINKMRFGTIKFNITDHTSTQKSLDLKLNKEVFLDFIINKNQLYFLTVVKSTSTLNLYTLDKNLTPTKKTYSLRTIEHPNPYRPQEKRTLYSMLNVVEGFSGNFSNIRHNGINPLETTVKDIKLYHKDNFITIGVDSNNKVAHFFTVDLTTFKLTYKSFEKPSIKKGFKKNNTFLLDKYLFLLACSSEKMKFQIHNFKTNSLIKEYSLTKNDSITIKNGPIIVENGTYSDYRELEKTAKYLRKISFDKLGISVEKTSNKYHVILGGITKIGGLEPTGFGGNSLGATPSLSYKKTSYPNRSTYINCLFNKDFEHAKGEIPLNNYTLLKEFEEKIKSPKALNTIINKEKIYYAYYNTEDKKYRIFRM